MSTEPWQDWLDQSSMLINLTQSLLAGHLVSLPDPAQVPDSPVPAHLRDEVLSACTEMNMLSDQITGALPRMAQDLARVERVLEPTFSVDVSL